MTRGDAAGAGWLVRLARFAPEEEVRLADRWVRPGDRIWLVREGAGVAAWVGLALERGATLLLASPGWVSAWQEAGQRMLDPTLLAGADAEPVRRAAPGPERAGRLWVSTGGTGGRLGLVEHDAATLEAAARGYGAWWGRPFRAVGVLPTWHVSGLMPAVRAAVLGGEWENLDGPGALARLPEQVNPAGVTLSVVPTQLGRLLPDPAAAVWLAATDLVLVGGAATNPDLRRRALAAGLPLALSYGMTETAAAAAITGPGPAAAADVPVATVLPGLRATTAPDGRLILAGEPVARAKWSDTAAAAGWMALPTDPGGGRRWETGDRGTVTAAGIQVLGRLDRFINTGGEKVDPAVVVAALEATGLVREAWVAGEPDPDWGERVVAWVVPTGPAITATGLAAAVRERLPIPARPKSWRLLPALPRTAAGKVDAARLPGG